MTGSDLLLNKELFSALRMWNFSIRQRLQLDSFPLYARAVVTCNLAFSVVVDVLHWIKYNCY